MSDCLRLRNVLTPKGQNHGTLLRFNQRRDGAKLPEWERQTQGFTGISAAGTLARMFRC